MHLAALLLLAAAGHAVPPHATSPEGLVALLMFGLRDDLAADGPDGVMVWRRTGRSPAQFEGALNTPRRKISRAASVTVTREATCRFRAEIRLTEGLRQGAATFRADFSKIAAMAVDGGRVAVAGDGLCRAEAGGACREVKALDLLGEVAADRHAQAHARLRRDVCPAAKP